MSNNNITEYQQIIVNSKENNNKRLAIEISKKHWVWYFLEKKYFNRNNSSYIETKVFESCIETDKISELSS